jgi:hypothetical protein
MCLIKESNKSSPLLSATCFILGQELLAMLEAVPELFEMLKEKKLIMNTRTAATIKSLLFSTVLMALV